MKTSTATTSDGVQIAVHQSGTEDGTPLVLLHGLGEGAGSWAPVVPALGRSHRLIAVDLRGHGDSDWPGTYSRTAMTDDVEELLDQLELADAVLIGHSLGGIVAYDVAARRPDLLHRLVIEDVAPARARPPRTVPPRPEAELDFDWAVVAAIWAEVDAGDPSLWEALPAITAPTLIIAGGPDSHISHQDLEAAAARIPCAELVTIAAGHSIHETRPDEFSAAILQWFADLDRPVG